MHTINPTAAKKGKATELSHIVAGKLVRMRAALKKSQRDFAELIGVSFQQYQKYEKGKDRLSLEKAVILCEKLGLSLDIFEGVTTEATGFAEERQSAYGLREKPITDEEKEILKIFRAVPKRSRKNVLETMRQLGKMASGKNT